MKKDIMLSCRVWAPRDRAALNAAGSLSVLSVRAVHTLAANLVSCVRPRHDIEGLASC